MPSDSSQECVVGVDGCRAGWIAVFKPVGQMSDVRVEVISDFEALLHHALSPSIIAVDMPIGLPECTGPNGRAPERAVRPYLGQRQSSVFSMPSRSAVYADTYEEACRLALKTSDPPRKVAKQGYFLFPKVREIDRLMTPALGKRVFEVHPELALWRLNGEQAMHLPKKVKGKANPDGLKERQALLERYGFPSAIFEAKRAKGVGPDDLIDAAANTLIAERLYKGEAKPFPEPLQTDERGIPVAIWA